MKKVKILCEVEIDVDRMFENVPLSDEEIIKKCSEKVPRNIYAFLHYHPTNDGGCANIANMKVIKIEMDNFVSLYGESDGKGD